MTSSVKIGERLSVEFEPNLLYFVTTFIF